MRDAVEVIPQVGSRSFSDFDRFRESIRGWETNPFQLSPGPLRLGYEFLCTDGLTVARLRANRSIADVSTIEPAVNTFVVTLAPQRWCGIRVPPGSLLLMGAGREYHSVLAPDWESIEFTVSDALLHEAVPALAEARPLDLGPEGCVFSLPDRALASVKTWARQLFARIEAPSRGRAGTPHRLDPLRLAAEAREEVLSTILPALFPRPGTTHRLSHVRGARYARVADAMRVHDASCLRGKPTIAHLSGALGVSRRSLELAFHDAVGCSPHRFFLCQRLGRVRRELLAGTRVTDAALAHHFVSLGRFSDQYRRLFGELPSGTVASSPASASRASPASAPAIRASA